MGTIFAVLYAIHPLMPIVFLALMFNGLVVPAICVWRKRLPMDIGAIRAKAKRGDSLAKYAYLSWLAFVVPTTALALLLLLSIVLR
jgi:hypothetical protein